jgi:hypothetical protein
MIRFALVVALLAGSAVPVQAAKPDGVDGHWLVVHRYYTPSKVTGFLGKLLTNLGTEVDIRNGKFSSRDPDKGNVYLLADFRADTDPKTVDLRKPANPNQVLLGIWRLDGHILTIEVGSGNQRPTGFMNAQNDVMLILKRARKKEANGAAPATP